MKKLFCNDCSLSDTVPHFIADKILGKEQFTLIESRYRVMRENYDFTYAKWLGNFGNGMTPFNGYTDTTIVSIPISHSIFKADFDSIGKGAIGLDLPTWFNIQKYRPRVMLIAQDPLRSNKWYGECRDATISSPFGLHDATHREKGNGGKMVYELVKQLVAKEFGVYLTDARKFFIYDHSTTDAYSVSRTDYYAKVLQEEIELVKPSLCVCFGNQAVKIISEMNLTVRVLGLPHLSGTARGAIIKRFSILKNVGATAENIAEQYTSEIDMNIV